MISAQKVAIMFEKPERSKQRSGREPESQQTTKNMQLKRDNEKLKHDNARLKHDNARLKRYNARLKLLVQDPKEQSEAKLTESHSPIAPDPYKAWIRENLDSLKSKYPSHYVAIDLTTGMIVVAEQEGKVFARKFQELIDHEGAAGGKHVRMHTSIYVDGAE